MASGESLIGKLLGRGGLRPFETERVSASPKTDKPEASSDQAAAKNPFKTDGELDSALEEFCAMTIESRKNHPYYEFLEAQRLLRWQRMSSEIG